METIYYKKIGGSETIQKIVIILYDKMAQDSEIKDLILTMERKKMMKLLFSLISVILGDDTEVKPSKPI